MDSLLMKKLEIYLSWSNNLTDSIKTTISILLIICSLEKLTSPLNNVLPNNPLELEICLVLWLSLLLEDSFLSKMPKKSILLPISYKEVIFSETNLEFLLLNLWELLICSTISLNFLSPSMTELLIEEMYWEELMKVFFLLLWLFDKLLTCMMD